MDKVEILNLLIFDHDTWNTVKKVFLAYKGIKMNIFSHIWVSGVRTLIFTTTKWDPDVGHDFPKNTILSEN